MTVRRSRSQRMRGAKSVTPQPRAKEANKKPVIQQTASHKTIRKIVRTEV
jgi:hypothetical protein